MTVERVEVPAGTLVSKSFPRVDYADAFRTALEGEVSVDEVVAASFRAMPGWIRALMAVRDGAVSLVGLKTDGARANVPDTFARGDVIGLFRVLERDEREIVLGEDDRHLDFRASFLLTPAGEGTALTVSTVVRFHNALGRAYFVPVGPGHRWIVPAMMRAARASLARR